MSVRENAVAILALLVACHIGRAQDVATGESTETATSAEDVEFFEHQIAPIFKRRCYPCHSHESGKAKGGLVLDSRRGWEKGGSEGAAIVPGKPDESLLMEAVRYQSYEMPPDEQLPAAEIALLERWIARGAPDPRESNAQKIDPEKLWALRPIQRPDVPDVKAESWGYDDLDAFILQRLEAEGITPASDADHFTILRRVTFDLTGLPPTPEEIEAFVNDTSGHAYENVVDRLLDSPGFGDHWARHWFDLSCYADLADIQGNVLIRDAWRYRDYVIAAFNSDKPLDRFIHEQIAGDLLPYDNDEQHREQIIATGYLAIGPWTLQNYIKPQLDADVVDHQIDRIGRTFLGQTLACARCHDHKFDPVPMADYYALAGIFHSTLTTRYDGPGVWSVISEIRLPAPKSSPEEQARRQEELADLRSRWQTLQAELTPLLLRIPGGSEANVLTLEKPIAANEKGTQYELSFEAGPSVWTAASQQTTAADGLQIDLLREDGSILVGFRHSPGTWSGAKDAQTLKGARFAYTGDGSGGIRVRIASATPGSSRFGGAIDDLKISEGQRTCFFEDFDSLSGGPIEGAQADTSLPVLAQAAVPGWTGGGLNHSHAVDLGNGNFAIQFYGGGAHRLANAKPVTPAEKEAHAAAMDVEKELQDVDAKIAQAEKQDAPEYALAVRDVDEPADRPIYRRGDFQNLGDIVPRGFLTAVSTSTRHTIPDGTSGRLQLAQWLTDSENPLTSRVLVNRIWHHLFGKGLVRTVDYFGVHGESPSHPELLDFLAIRMREDDGWSLKKTVRRMVLSRTYQMASTHNGRAVEVDPDNRLMWQMPRRRLSAESIRDAMLAASGQLDPRRGGPSLGLEMKGNINGLGGNVNPPTWAGQIPEDIRKRRSVYLPLQRERPLGELEILSVFDFPHPSDITGARHNTTVARQALFLLNAPFVKEQASKLAERLKKDEPADERARINRLYLLTVNRPAGPADIETAMTFLDQCAEDLNGDRTAVWSQLCHAVLGSNGFLFRE
ncbi:MAG TPA: PSD1 and planctomycete cytochrome C domain-containing protein [Edaphobacter sp.]|nr:PSD1 and planctomycete cytochrome C domain-containing protein [Pirellulales bacterium]HZY72949.1 PSD1 and planctomycete cytochrome C domain-containing protein [Edaphobacter sp.]